jgi:hypothetical protein
VLIDDLAQIFADAADGGTRPADQPFSVVIGLAGG